MSISEVPLWVNQPWPSCLPGDYVIAGDIVVDRSLLLASRRDATSGPSIPTEAHQSVVLIDDPSPSGGVDTA